MKRFNLIKAYFLSDHRALSYIKNSDSVWTENTVIDKMDVLGLTKGLSEALRSSLVHTLAKKSIANATHAGNLRIFDLLDSELKSQDGAKFVITKFLCAHRPTVFPIWDEERFPISQWVEDDRYLLYPELKVKIDRYKRVNNLDDQNYYFFNKFLWYIG